ncbi:MAG TPA: type I-C CRISPR-associated protein Cas7/Csd2, partial [Bacilli bacterium]|nr:type I-C CRISPR-associated protein Cas7/Csd2 [Bacilli bacterium]
WWDHGCKAGKYSSAKVHGSLRVNGDGSFEIGILDGLDYELIDGF